MSNFGYIRGIGAQDYNFGVGDFTIEFWALTNSSGSPQTLFEVTNNEVAAAELYIKTRFYTIINDGYLICNCVQIKWPGIISGNSYSVPWTKDSGYVVFYQGKLLTLGTDFIFDSGNITLLVDTAPNSLIEVGEILTQITSISTFTQNVSHFVSIERQSGLLYLFLDGKCQGTDICLANIPTQILNNQSFSIALNRVASPALLTIGANRDGLDPLTGSFGDFRITNGHARYIKVSQPISVISSQFNDTTLGQDPADIIISGGGFNDPIESHAPEELVPAQIFDTLDLRIYQTSLSNSESVIMGFQILKDTISIGPYGSCNLTANGSTNTFRVPWLQVNNDAAAVIIDGVVQSSISWQINNYDLNLDVIPELYVQVILTGTTTYHAIGANAVATLTSNLANNAQSINISNSSGFIVPVPSNNIRGEAFINGEKITYLYIDQSFNVLSGLMRGVSGTGTPAIHNANSQIISMSFNRTFPGSPGTNTWYNLGSNSASDGNSLQYSNTAIALFLLNQGTTAP